MAWYEDSIHLIRRLHRHGMLPHHSHVPSVLRSSGPSDPTSPWVRLVSHARVSSTCFSSTIQPFSFSLSSLPPSSFFILLFSPPTHHLRSCFHPFLCIAPFWALTAHHEIPYHLHVRCHPPTVFSFSFLLFPPTHLLLSASPSFMHGIL